MRFKSYSLIELNVNPRRIIEAKEVVLEKLDKYVNQNSSIEQKWPKIYKKIQNQQQLRFREIKYAIHKTDTLTEEECEFLIQKVKENFSKSEMLASIFSGVFDLLKPWKSVQLAMSLDKNEFENSSNSKFLFENKELVINSKQIEEFSLKFFENINSVQELSEFFQSTEIIKKIAIGHLREKTLEVIFVNQTLELLNFLIQVFNKDNFLTLIDRYIGNFLLEHRNWSSQILDQNYPLNKLVVFVLDQKINISEFGERLKYIYDKYLLTSDFIKELRVLSVERADYWEYKIKNFDGVEVRKFGNRKFGMAMYLKKFVLVEFAPTGNALYFYKKEVFDEQVRDTSNWSNKDLAGIDIGQGSFSIHKELRDLKNGNFIHSLGWMKRMDKTLLVITNV